MKRGKREDFGQNGGNSWDLYRPSRDQRQERIPGGSTPRSAGRTCTHPHPHLLAHTRTHALTLSHTHHTPTNRSTGRAGLGWAGGPRRFWQSIRSTWVVCGLSCRLGLCGLDLVLSGPWSGGGWCASSFPDAATKAWSAHKPSSGHPGPSSNLVRRKWNCTPWPTKGGNNRVVGTKMRLKSQAQAGLRGSQAGDVGKLSRVPHDRQQSRAEHDTTRHDTSRPIPLPLYKYALPPSPLSVLPSSHAHMCIRTHIRGPIRIPLLLLLRPARDTRLQINVHAHQQGTAQNRVAEAVVVVLVVDAHRSV